MVKSRNPYCVLASRRPYAVAHGRLADVALVLCRRVLPARVRGGLRQAVTVGGRGRTPGAEPLDIDGDENSILANVHAPPPEHPRLHGAQPIGQGPAASLPSTVGRD